MTILGNGGAFSAFTSRPGRCSSPRAESSTRREPRRRRRRVRPRLRPRAPGRLQPRGRLRGRCRRRGLAAMPSAGRRRPSPACRGRPRASRGSSAERARPDDATATPAPEGPRPRLSTRSESPPIALAYGSARRRGASSAGADRPVDVFAPRRRRRHARAAWHRHRRDGLRPRRPRRMTIRDRRQHRQGDAARRRRLRPARHRITSRSSTTPDPVPDLFDRPVPGESGFLGLLSPRRDAVLAATRGLAPDALPALPRTWSDALIVARVNRSARFDPETGAR